MKVVINKCFGGFGVSEEAKRRILELDPSWNGYNHSLDRTSPHLVRVIEEIGAEISSGAHAKLKIIEIPDDITWHVEEYDGQECVAESHRTWS